MKSDKHLAAQNLPRTRRQAAATKKLSDKTWNAGRHLRERQAKPQPVVTVSWWTSAAQVGFTALARTHEPEMRRATKTYEPWNTLDAPSRRPSRADVTERY